MKVLPRGFGVHHITPPHVDCWLFCRKSTTPKCVIPYVSSVMFDVNQRESLRKLSRSKLKSVSRRWRWSRTFWTTNCVTSVRGRAAEASLRPSSVPTSHVCSTTASSAGRTSTPVPAESSTSRWSKREPTGRARFTSAGTNERRGSARASSLRYQYRAPNSIQYIEIYGNIYLYLL